MGYYQGDFYGGAQGDPFWGALASWGIKGIGALTKLGRRGAPSFPAVGMGGSPVGKIIAAGRGAIMRHPVLSGAGGAGVIGAAGAMIGRHGMVPAGMRGFHLNKHGKMVRNRRMRVTNPKALHRAIRRCHGFSRLALKVLRFTHPRRVKGRPFFARKRKKK